jgi:integrase
MPKYGDLPVARISPEVITKFQRDEKAKGLEDATVNRKCQIILAILNYAVKQRRIPFNPDQGYSKLREAQKETEFWSKDEAISFLTLMNERYPRDHKKRWVYVAYLVALNTGMRAAEIWGLKPEDLSPIANVITVRRQLNRISQEMAPTKSRRGRIVPCSSEVAEELRWLIARNKERTTPNETEAESETTTIFCNERGQPVNHDNFFDRVWKKDLKVWGGRSIRFHDLRHTATTLMIASGVDIKTVKEICGHADIATTMNYVHLVASAVEKVPLLFSLKPKVSPAGSPTETSNLKESG